MKISCLKSDLENALLAAQKLLSKNPNLPILENALFEARGDELFIKATNIELFLEYKITVSLEKDGIFAIPVDILLQSIRNSKTDKKIDLELKGNTVSVKTENSNFSIKTVSYEDFPQLKKPEELKNSENKINKNILINGIKAVQAYSSNLTIKPELASIYIYKEAQDLIFVATDQFRLAEKKIKLDRNTDFETLLLPNKNANTLIKILESSEEEDFIFSNKENQLSLQSEHIFISSRVLDLSFPDYKVILPKEYKSKIILLKEDLSDALKKSALFTDKFSKIKLSLKNEKLKIKAQNQDIGEIEEYIKVKSDGENEFSVNLNNRFLQESLSSLNSDTVEIWFLTESAPLLIKALADNSFIYILMPMNN